MVHSLSCLVRIGSCWVQSEVIHHLHNQGPMVCGETSKVSSSFLINNARRGLAILSSYGPKKYILTFQAKGVAGASVCTNRFLTSLLV